MDLELPPPAAQDWHLVVRLSVYPERSSLAIAHYRTMGVRSKEATYILRPKEYSRPQTLWDIGQMLSLGADIYIGKITRGEFR